MSFWKKVWKVVKWLLHVFVHHEKTCKDEHES